jgi:hypothetical protein
VIKLISLISKPARLRLAGLLLGIMLLSACSIPARDSNLQGETPSFSARTLILVFEREGSYQPITGAPVTLSLKAPAQLLAPPSGEAVTGPQGEVELTYKPVAIYDQPALNDGDIIADFPAEISVTLKTSAGEVFEWDLEDNLSYARYQDPLYQGLNRDPDPGPVYLNLILSK